MTAVSQLWLGDCFEEFPTFPMEPMWPDSVGCFTSCQTWVHEAAKTASSPENVKLLWQLFAGAVLWYYFEGSWQWLTLVSRLTGRTLICICNVLVQINNIWCGSQRSDIPKKFENKEMRCWVINVAKTTKPGKNKIYKEVCQSSRQREDLLHRTLQCQQTL